MMPVCEEVSTVFTMTSRCFFFFLSRKSQRKTESWKSYSTGKSLDFSLWYVGLRYLMWGKLEAIEQNTWIETAAIHWDDFGFLCLNQSNVTQGVCWNFRFGGGGTCPILSTRFQWTKPGVRRSLVEKWNRKFSRVQLSYRKFSHDMKPEV